METMMINSREITRTFFNVTKREDAEGRTALFADNGYKIANVSEGYKLIKNEEIIMPFVERFGESAFKRVTTINNGKSVLYEIETGLDIEVAPGDVLKQRLLVVNSYDKTKAFKFVLGAFRSYCFNGLYNGLALMNIQRVHYGNYDVMGPINEVLGRFNDLSQYDHWRTMAKTDISQEDQKGFIESFKPYETEDEYTTGALRNKEIQRIAGNYERYRAPQERSTVWGLYNKVNWSIARAFRTRDQREYVKVNGKLESALMKHFSLN